LQTDPTSYYQKTGSLGVLASMVGGWLATGRNDSGGPAAVRACNFGGMFLWSVSHLPSCLHFSVELAGMVICNKWGMLEDLFDCFI